MDNNNKRTFRVQLRERVETAVVDVCVQPVTGGRRTRAREMGFQVGKVHRGPASVARPVLDGRSRRTSGFRHRHRVVVAVASGRREDPVRNSS